MRPAQSYRIVIWTALLFGAWCTSLLAQTRELDTDKRQKLDVVLVLDGSGSMLVTDPDRLRYEGAKLFLRFLSADDRVAIVSFAESAKVIRPLGSYNPAQAEEISNLIDKIPAEGRYTDLFIALESAKSLLLQSPRPEARTAVLLLSDGKMEPEPSKGSPVVRSTEMMEQLVPGLKTAGVTVYTMALSDQADKELLSEVASAADGVSWYAPNADIIHQSFADLFLAVKKPQLVPLTSKGFKIDQDIEEATFYINRPTDGKVTLHPPKGPEYSLAKRPADSKWFSGPNFDVVTIGHPEPGDWSVEGADSGDGFATVLTNLRLVTDWPASVRADEKVRVRARLYEGDKPVALPEMSGTINFGFRVVPTDKISEPIIKEILNDEGTSGDDVEKDGIFSQTVVIKEPGEYKLMVIADGKTFKRTQQIPFRVKPQLVRVEVAKAEVSAHGEAPATATDNHGAEAKHGDHDEQHHDAPHGEGHGEESTEHSGKHEEAPPGDDHGHGSSTAKEQFEVRLSPEVATFRHVDVKLFAVDAGRKKYALPITKSSKDAFLYTSPVTRLPKPGEFQITAELEAETKKKEKIHAESGSITYELEEGAAVEVVELAAVEEHKDDETPRETSPWVYIGLLSVLNAGLAAGALWFIKNKMGGSQKIEVDPAFDVDLSKLVSQLEVKAATSDVDLSDPAMTDDQEVVGNDVDMAAQEAAL